MLPIKEVYYFRIHLYNVIALSSSAIKAENESIEVIIIIY